MSDKPNIPRQIGEAILSELDHFQENFKPSGGSLSLMGQIHIASEPCVGYAKRSPQSLPQRGNGQGTTARQR
jgi:hypothetical protein